MFYIEYSARRSYLVPKLNLQFYLIASTHTLATLFISPVTTGSETPFLLTIANCLGVIFEAILEQ